MVSIKSVNKTIVFLSICVMYHTVQGDCRPLRRSISEVQLMHNVGVRKHVQERQDWLEAKMRDIHTASLRNAESVTTRRLPQDIPDLKDITPSELAYILNILDKLSSE
uniref:Parathyroid hormone n=1 Tax=Electrophorus electricus TaxID=8005 RepID=A0A4W4EVE7_ELEEL